MGAAGSRGDQEEKRTAPPSGPRAILGRRGSPVRVGALRGELLGWCHVPGAVSIQIIIERIQRAVNHLTVTKMVDLLTPNNEDPPGRLRRAGLCRSKGGSGGGRLRLVL